MNYRQDHPISIIAGQVTEVGERHIVLSSRTRVMLPTGQNIKDLAVGANVTVRVIRNKGQWIAESITPLR